MPRGYWRYVAAAVGFLITGPSQPKDSTEYAAQAAQDKVGQPVPATATGPSLKPFDSPVYVVPCKEPEDHNRCDLEAQWKAADAGRDAADWSKWQMVLSAFGLAGLLYSLVLTRRATTIAVAATVDADKALAIAERNADAAAKQTAIMERSYKARERPYILVRVVEHDLNKTFEPFREQFRGKTRADFPHFRDILKPKLIYRICNYGASAAIVRSYLGIVESLPTFKGHHPASGGHDSIIIPPGGESENIVAIAMTGSPERTSFSDLTAFHGNVNFTDVFGTLRVINFLYLMLHSGDSLSHVHTEEQTYDPSGQTWRPTQL